MSSLSEVQEEPQLCLEGLEMPFENAVQLHPSLRHPFKQIQMEHVVLLTPRNPQRETQNVLHIIYDQNGPNRAKICGCWVGFFSGGGGW